jgi:hypothetical protein
MDPIKNANNTKLAMETLSVRPPGSVIDSTFRADGLIISTNIRDWGHRDAPDFVEVTEAGSPWGMLCGISVVFSSLGDVFALVSCQRGSLRPGRYLWAFNRRKPLVASSMPAAVQRSAIAALRQCLTLRQTRRTVPMMFSIALVQASERRAAALAV